MKCDVIATGIVNAARKLEMKVPLVVRLEGTNVEQGKKILADSGLALEPADSLSQAAEKIVQIYNKSRIDLNHDEIQKDFIQIFYRVGVKLHVYLFALLLILQQ